MFLRLSAIIFLMIVLFRYPILRWVSDRLIPFLTAGQKTNADKIFNRACRFLDDHGQLDKPSLGV